MSVHYKHYDGQPLCWPMEKAGKYSFRATRVEAEVSCEECLAFLAESEA